MTEETAQILREAKKNPENPQEAWARMKERNEEVDWDIDNMLNNTGGSLITVEGIDGAGKTTVVNTIEDNVDNTVTTKEPSDLWTGEQVYRAISSDSETPATTDFFLFMADRMNHIENLIRPALREGKTVVSDRYADSSRAYQEIAMREEIPLSKHYIEEVMEPWNIKPDTTIYLDITPETAIRRADGGDKYEKKEFLQKVRANYERIIAEDPRRFIRIDGEMPKDEVKNEVLKIIDVLK